MRIPLVDHVMSLVRKPGVAPKRTTPREDRVKMAFANVPMGIAVATPDGHWLFLNERFRSLVGYTTGELGRITLNSITHPDDARGERMLMKRLVGGELTSYRIEKRLMVRNGQYRSFDVLTALAHDVFIHVLDEPQPSVVDHLPGVAVIRTDERGTITGWSAGAEAIFGYSRAEILGKNRRVLYRDADSWAGKSTGVLQNASLHRMEMDDWRVRKDGSHFWVRCTIAPFDSSGVKGYVETVMATSEPVLAKKDPPKFVAHEPVEPLRVEIEKRKRTEESLREAFDDLRRTSEETMNELRIMTAALRDEIDRRKLAEDELRSMGAKLAAATAPVVEEIVSTAEPEPEWRALASTTPATLLLELAAARRTGTLLIESHGHQKEIFFEDGRVFSCASNDREKFLAERLVMDGAISEEQRRKALEIKQASQLALGRILLILGAIDETQLIDAMRRKLADEIADLLAWTAGRYVFVEGDVPSLQLVPLRINVEELLAPPILYIASTKSRKVHHATCISAKRISVALRVETQTTEGFEPCRLCFR
ncbi:MAG TPA: PAS domain S-box protein [Thermoanaerobaculia bacterium]|nr:PAS domain S-box protein [Thermoanaerobaculia bacterium]